MKWLCYSPLSPFACEMVTNVEFALHPQHETSCYSEIQTKEDLKCKFRKQLGRLSIIPLNSKDKGEPLKCQCQKSHYRMDWIPGEQSWSNV